MASESKNPEQYGQKDIEKLIKDYQSTQAQMRGSAMQMEQYQLQKAEIDTAKAELEKATGKIYSTVGGIMVETNKEEALKNVTEKAEIIQVRLQSSTKQYNDLKAKEQRLREKLTELSRQQPPAEESVR